VLSVGYRLAPEHPFPAPLDDVLAVARTLTEDDGPVVIGGESAGAHLAALALLGLRDGGRPALAGAVLTFGVFDLAGASSRSRIDLLLPGVPVAERRRPDLSPLFADLRGMPPARILVGTRDGLLDDSLMLAARWQQVAAVELDVVAGAGHAFTLLDLAVTRRAEAAEHAFVRNALTAGADTGPGRTMAG
jgi:acetyl esterase/lipase